MAQRQEAVNVVLAQLLKKRGLVAAPEQIININKSGKRLPDVIVDFWGLRLAIEAEFRTRKYNALKKAYDAGVKIACGTDIYTTLRKYVGKSAYELELMVRYGMSEMDAIKAATKTAAEALWWQDRVGTLEVGILADVLVVDGNPLKDIKILQDKSKLPLVIKDGKIAVDRRDGYPKLYY